MAPTGPASGSDAEMKDGRTRKPSTINRELEIISKIFSLAIKYGVTYTNPCAEVPLLPENNRRVRCLFEDEAHRLMSVLTGSSWTLVAARYPCNRHRHETRRSVQSHLGESRISNFNLTLHCPFPFTLPRYHAGLSNDVRLFVSLNNDARGPIMSQSGPAPVP